MATGDNMKELIEIQAILKAPKNQFNSFGKYKYRSCEDILEAVKPLCCDKGILLTISDEMVNIGQFNYIKATVTASNGEKTHSCSAFAREAVTKKGMDDSQITGTASSYARKYALNGFFLIDDTKDADTMNNNEAPKKQSPVENMASDQQIKQLTGYAVEMESSDPEKSTWIHNQIKAGLTFNKADNIIKRIMKA